jgi:hypothetical protein
VACTQEGNSQSGARRAVLAAAALAVYAIAWFAFFLPVWLAPDRRMIGYCHELCDAIQFVWGINWGAHSLAHYRNPFATDVLNFPWGVNGMWQTWTVSLGWLLFPLSFVLRPLALYNLAVTSACTMNSLGGYLVARAIVGGFWGPLLAGVYFGFSPYFEAQLEGHLHVVATFCVCLAFLCLRRLALGRSFLRWGLALGLCQAFQIFTGEELLFTFWLLCATVAALSLVVSRLLGARWVDRAVILNLARGIGVGWGFTLVICGPALYYQFYGANAIRGAVHPQRFTIASSLLKGYAEYLPFLNPNLVLGQSTYGDAYAPFISLFAIALVVAAVVAGRRRVRTWVIAGTCATFLVFSLGPYLTFDGKHRLAPLPWTLLDGLPLFDQVLPSRLGIYVYLCIALLLADLLRSARARTAAWRVLAVCLSLATLLSDVQEAFRIPYFYASLPQPRFFLRPRQGFDPNAGVLTAPVAGASRYSAAPMLWQADARFGFKLVGGYFIGLPPANEPAVLAGLRAIASSPPGKPLPGLPKPGAVSASSQLESCGVSLVVVGPSPWVKEMKAYVARTLKERVLHEGGVFVVRLTGHDRRHVRRGSGICASGWRRYHS